MAVTIRNNFVNYKDATSANYTSIPILAQESVDDGVQAIEDATTEALTALNTKMTTAYNTLNNIEHYADLESLNDKFTGYTENKQYITSVMGTEGKYWNTDDTPALTTITSDNSGVAITAITVPAGTYTAVYMTNNSRIRLQDPSNTKINSLDTLFPATNGVRTITINYPATFYFNTTPARFNAGQVKFINGDVRNNLPADSTEGVYNNTFMEFNAVKDDITVMPGQINSLQLRQNANTLITVGHKGGNAILAPNASKAACIIAKKMGINKVEIDVLKAADGTYVCFHGTTMTTVKTNEDNSVYTLEGYKVYVNDNTYYYLNDSVIYTLDGTATELSIDTLTAANCASIDLTVIPYSIFKYFSFGWNYGNEYINSPILTFEEWIRLIKILGMSCCIDLKTSDGNTYIDLATIINKYRMGPYVEFMQCSVAYAPTLINLIPGVRISRPASSINETFFSDWETYSQTTPITIRFNAYSLYHDVEASLTVLNQVKAHPQYILRGSTAVVDTEATPNESYKTGAALAPYVRKCVELGFDEMLLDNYTILDAYNDYLNI